MLFLTRALLLPLVLGFLALAEPAEASKLFTLDFNNNDFNDLDGSDDLVFSFTGSTGVVSGRIRAIKLEKFGLQATVDAYNDFTAGAIPIDFPTMDVLIFDIKLDAGSAPIDEVGVAVASDPTGTDPTGAGYFLGCDPGVPVGCIANVPGGGETTDSAGIAGMSLQSGGGFFPGTALWEFSKGTAGAGNLQAGEISRRLFVTYDDTGLQSPLSKEGQKAKFMLSSGTNSSQWEVDIVPEPGTGVLVGVGMTMLAWSRRRSSRRQ